MSVVKTEHKINLYEDGLEFGSNKYKHDIWEFRIKHWSIKKEKYTAVECIGVNMEAIAGWLIKQGYHEYDGQYYHIWNNIVSYCSFDDCHHAVLKYTREFDRKVRYIWDNGDVDNAESTGREGILNATQQTLKLRLGSLKLAVFKIDKAKWLTDDVDACYLTFQNEIIKVTKKKTERIDYADSPGLVWEEQLIKKDFKKSTKPSSIQRFLDMAIGKDNRIHYMSAIGYMIHNFASPEGSSILLCIDGNLSPLNEGGNGKDFMGQILAQVRKVDYIEGKQMTDNNRFLFESIHPDTQIAWFRDIKKSYKFENMYNLTEGNGIQVRQINKDPFRVKAKVGVSLQHLIDMEGRSDQRRQVFLKFGDEVGKRGGVGKAIKESNIFSDSWRGDWNSFYTLIVSCIQTYLKKGLVKQNVDDLIQLRVDEISENYELDKLELGKFYTYAGALELLSNDLSPDRQKIFYMKKAIFSWAKNLGYSVLDKETHKNQKGFRVKSSLYVSSKKENR